MSRRASLPSGAARARAAVALATAVLLASASACMVSVDGTRAGGGDADADADGPSCPTGEARCDGRCIDVQSDALNCGGCDVRCDPNETCEGGECTCPAPYLSCDGECVDTDRDRDHCGGCDRPCDVGYVCDGTGQCATDCAPGFELCFAADGSPYCADLSSDPGDCGSCGWVCDAPANARSICEGALCGYECLGGWGDSDGEAWNGCECRVLGAETCNGLDDDCDGSVDEDFDCVFGATAPCTGGSAGTCVGTTRCEASAGLCAWSPCASATWQCEEVGATEGCAPPGTACLGSRACGGDCTWSACRETCDPPTPDCCADGCTDLSSDPSNCGTCGLGCAGGHCCDSACHECCDDRDCDDLEECTTDTCGPRTQACRNAGRDDMEPCTGGLCCGEVCRVGGSCCTSADCPGGVGSCSGTATPCRDLRDATACSAQLGCFWRNLKTGTDYCDGTARECELMDDGCGMCGCAWDPETGECAGTGLECSAMSSPSCYECGCGIGPLGSCAAPAFACPTFSCERQRGCDWVARTAVCSAYGCVDVVSRPIGASAAPAP